MSHAFFIVLTVLVLLSSSHWPVAKAQDPNQSQEHDEGATLELAASRVGENQQDDALVKRDSQVTKFKIPGVLSFDGTLFHKVSSDLVPDISGNATEQEPDRSFYVSLLVYLTQDATGEHRGLFFKGQTVVDRTPSLWLLPNTNQVTYRVVSKNRKEVWGTSHREIPLKTWTHLHLKVGEKELAFYINGDIDSKVELGELKPAFNLGYVHLGRDISAKPGFSGFLSNLEIRSFTIPSQDEDVEDDWYDHDLPLEEDKYVKEHFAAAMKSVAEVTGRDTCERRKERESFLEEEVTTSQVPGVGDATNCTGPRKVFDSNWDLLQSSLRDGEDMSTFLQLAWKNYLGIENPKSCEVGLFYMQRAAKIAYSNYQKPGQQFQVENVLLTPTVGMERGDQNGQESDESMALDLMADQGNAHAALALGNRYFYGMHGFTKNMTRALEYYKKSHDTGSVAGTIAFAKMNLRGDGLEVNGTKAKELYEEVIQKADGNTNYISEAQNGLGYIFYYGMGMEKNLTKALHHFELAANEGSSQGAFNAALLLDGTGEDREKAFKYFQMAASDGNALAYYQLATYQIHGEEGIPRNCSAAFDGFWRMAQIGPWSTQLGEGLKHYLEGKYEEAYEHYMNAARMGYSYGQYNAIYILENRRFKRNNLLQRYFGREAPTTVLDDASIIPQLCDILVGSGDAGLQSWAHNVLGNCYLHGESHGCSGIGREGDPKKASIHFRTALPHSINAHFNLGDMYFWGKGVERNETKAFDLFRQGYLKAEKDLASILSISVYSTIFQSRRMWNLVKGLRISVIHGMNFFSKDPHS